MQPGPERALKRSRIFEGSHFFKMMMVTPKFKFFGGNWQGGVQKRGEYGFQSKITYFDLISRI